MNEQLHQIYLKANELARETAKKKNKVNNPQQHTIYNEFVPLFAELIVNECLAMCRSTQSTIIANASDAYQDGREMGIEVAMNKIKDHFGVE